MDPDFCPKCGMAPNACACARESLPPDPPRCEKCWTLLERRSFSPYWVCPLPAYACVRIAEMRRELGPLRFDWEGAHDRLDKAGVLVVEPGAMGVHLHKRLDAALADRHALGLETMALRRALTDLLGIGESDEWECAHGARVSRRCGVPGCGLGPVRKVLAIASSEDLVRDLEASIRRDALAQLGGPETVDRVLALAGPDLQRIAGWLRDESHELAQEDEAAGLRADYPLSQALFVLAELLLAIERPVAS